MTLNKSFFQTLTKLNISTKIIEITEEQLCMMNNEEKLFYIYQINKISKNLNSAGLLFWLNKQVKVTSSNFFDKFMEMFGKLFNFSQTTIKENINTITMCAKILHDQMLIQKKNKSCSYTFYNITRNLCKITEII